MSSFASALLVWLSLGAGAPPADRSGTLRMFTVERLSAPSPPAEVLAMRPEPPALPPAHNVVRAVVGVGYVQGADWGADLQASGMVRNLDVQLDALVTVGTLGALFDRGRLLVQPSSGRWRLEAGDLFSNLRGPVWGARQTVRIAPWVQAGVVVLGPRPGTRIGGRSVIYQTRVAAGGAELDHERGTDESMFTRLRVRTLGHLEFEAASRVLRGATPGRDASAGVELRLWRQLSIGAGAFRYEREGDRSTWHSVSVRVPVHRYLSVGLERTLLATGATESHASAAVAQIHRGSWFSHHRYQWGRTDLSGLDVAGTFSRDQFASAMSFAAGPGIQVNFQGAAQWADLGRTQHWLESELTLRLTRVTDLQVASPMPGAFEIDRVRARLTQRLPGRFALVAEYGRPSSYQPIQTASERARYRLSVQKTVDVATAAGGGAVTGLVRDHIGRPVSGARVRLGPYAVDSADDGRFLFRHVPAGEFELALDADRLPADYASDGRSHIVRTTAGRTLAADLLVTPLNSIHGRVYADRNRNGRFDEGEGVAAVLRTGDRATASAGDGAYAFYNMFPGPHSVVLDAERLPGQFAPGSSTAIAVELTDRAPVTGADFVVVPVIKPVVWRGGL